MFATLIKSVLLQKAITWFKVGWPMAKGLVIVMQDGVVTKEEMHQVVDDAMGDRTEIRIWRQV
jgi:hypothetical protein